MPLRSFWELQAICDSITLGDGWTVEALDYTPKGLAAHAARFDASVEFAPIWFLRIRCDKGTCNVTGDDLSWRGRKWYVSQYSTNSEVVQTALKAYLTALEHEAREKFKWKGVAVFDPHLDLQALGDAINCGDIRQDARNS